MLGKSESGSGAFGESHSGDGLAGLSQTGIGVSGVSGKSIGVVGISNGVGVLGIGGTLSGQFIGDVDISGTLTKGGGGFKIDHPLDPANKYLLHSFVESPDMKNVYDGEVVLDTTGEAIVHLPAWFETLNRAFHYQLTPWCAGTEPLHSISVWFALISKGKRFDRHFKVHSWLAVFHRALVEGERALHEKHCPFGHRLLYGFSLLTPGPTSEPDRKVLQAAFGGESKREFSKRRADWCYHQLRISFYSAYCLQLNKHGIPPLAHMAASWPLNERCRTAAYFSA